LETNQTKTLCVTRTTVTPNKKFNGSQHISTTGFIVFP